MNEAVLQARELGWLDWGALVLAAGVFFWVASVQWRGALRNRAEGLLAAARLGAIALLLAAFLQPVWNRRVRVNEPSVAVVVDGSESMAVADAPGGEKRWDAALKRLGENLTGGRWVPSYFVLDRKLKAAPREKLAGGAPKGSLSNLAALEDVPREDPAARAVLLFTDGRHGAGQDAAEAAARSGVPVLAVGVGREDESPDLVLDGVRAPHFAFKNSEVEVNFRVECRRLDVREVAVTLMQGDQAVAVKKVALSTAAVTEGTLLFKPSRTGQLSYRLRLPVFESETNRRNNAQTFSLDVARDRIRVLYISGQPGPQYAFLRHQLKTNPSVELVSFVILRDPSDAMNIPDGQLSLIPFPSQEVLLNQLSSFDVVVLEQFSFGLFGIGDAGMQALKDYVEKGGGLLLAGQTDVLGPQGPYAATSLASVLPVDLSAPVKPGPRRYTLDARAASHPLMAFGDGETADRVEWARLPALEGDGYFPAAVRPGAQALAVARSGSSEWPVLAAWGRGRGRVLMFFSMTSWRWALGESGAGRGTARYQTFWNNALRWLSASEDFRLVRLVLPREAAGVGEDAWLKALVRDADYRPLEGAQVQAVVQPPSGEPVSVALKPLGGGEYAEAFAPEAAGTYRVKVVAFSRGRKIGEDAGSFAAGGSWDENRDTTTDFRLLRRIAESTGGDFVPLESFDRGWLSERLDKLAWTLERHESVWNSPWVLAGLIALLLMEWALRRKRGGV